MAFTRTINVSGVSEIEGIDVNINFNYDAATPPTFVSFSFTTPENANVHGNCNDTHITDYYVNDGIVSDELLELVQDECIRVLDNYDTV